MKKLEVDQVVLELILEFADRVNLLQEKYSSLYMDEIEQGSNEERTHRMSKICHAIAEDSRLLARLIKKAFGSIIQQDKTKH